MKRTYICHLKENLNSQVLIQAWVKDIRDLSKIKFVLLRDKTGEIQAVALKEMESFDLISQINKESVVEVIGNVKENTQAKAGYEVAIASIRVITPAEPVLPIDISDKSQTKIDKRLDYRFLDTRTKQVSRIFKIRSKMFNILTNFFDGQGFININTPKITIMGVESGAELFNVKYFDKEAYLSQSPQVYKQMFVCGGFERVYEIAPVFRAEKSHTTRHVTEFTGVDFEMGFIRDENDVMDVIEAMIKDLLSKLKTQTKLELESFNPNMNVPDKIPRIDMKQVKEWLKEKNKILGPEDDLDAEAEKLVGEIAKEKFNSEFIFVTNYPFSVRPFYHMKPDNDPNGTRSFDLLWNGVEVATGAQREHRLDVLYKQAAEKGIDLRTMADYTEIFRFGAPPHGGVGFGLDRMTQRLLNLDNIRETILLPRDPERLKP